MSRKEFSESLIFLYKKVDEKTKNVECENEVLRLLNDRFKRDESVYQSKIRSLEKELKEKQQAVLKLTEEKGRLNLQICQMSHEMNECKRQNDFLMRVNNENNERRKQLRRSHNELHRRLAHEADLAHILENMQENLKG